MTNVLIDLATDSLIALVTDLVMGMTWKLCQRVSIEGILSGVF